MELKTAKEISIRRDQIVFRQSSWIFLTIALFLVGLVVGVFYWRKFGDLPKIGMWIMSCGFGIFFIACFSSWRKTLSSDNWILRLGNGRILIKFRSYYNNHFPDTDPQIIELSAEEIESVGIIKQKRVSFGFSGGPNTSYHTQLNFKIKTKDLALLQKQLDYEHTFKPPITGKHIKRSHRTFHVPVSVIDNRTIRIEWRSPQDFITPKIKVAIKKLAEYGITVAPLKKEFLDLTATAVSKKEIEDKIIQCCIKGQKMQAIALARKAFPMSLTEAKRFVDELQN